MNYPVILPGATLGVLGGGQLGRMFIHAAQNMGYDTMVLDPDVLSPAGQVSHGFIKTAYEDPIGLAKLASSCAAITTEFENVPADALQILALTRPVSPSAASVAIAQDRVAEKAHFVACAAKNGVDAITVAPYAVIETMTQLDSISEDLLPGILKTARMGYDGKGQIRVKTKVELAAAWKELGQVICVLEKMLPLVAEYSVIVARNANGAMVHFPIQCNVHVDGILAASYVSDDGVSPDIEKRAIAASKSIANELQYIGALCVEFFLLEDDRIDGKLVVNEIAPRPHNSGHYTLDACDVSQFELQVRTLCGLPLPQPRLHSPAIMLNLMGDLWFGKSAADSTDAQTPPWAKILALPGAHLHLYGKKTARKGRKMGHLTLTGASVEEVRERADVAAKILGITKYEPSLNSDSLTHPWVKA
jgi:5-(carboxyamino)imidazole ribonucleotide synthase